jgi:hypothetical protein
MGKEKLKKVHIGNDVWQCGALNQNFIQDGKLTSHLVIYGPGRKLYHLYGKDAEEICYELDGYGYLKPGNVCRGGNFAIESRLKIYILTHILDESKNWCFDLKKLPQPGKLKVIYENGTVKNTEFDGVKIEDVYVQKTFVVANRAYKFNHKRVSPIAYRIN